MPTLFIASPVEAQVVAQLRRLDPALTVIHEPDLLPVPRFTADHGGHPFTRTPEMQRAWHAAMAPAEILWGLPDAEDLPHLPNLRWVQATSTGVGPAVAKLGAAFDHVLVTTARGTHARPLAEFVFMALLAHFRGLAALQAEQRAHRWTRGCAEEIAGRTLVILGAGDLARGCARIAKALDMRVIAIARDPGRPRAHAALFDEVVGPADLHAAMARADAFVVTVPGIPATIGMIDAAALAALPRGAAFVNIGRGTVVDEAALVAALRAGDVGYAALDVTAIEPLPADSPLWDMPNVLISPHSASTVPAENFRIADILARNFVKWQAGRLDDMENVLDRALQY
jgi:phosphoglycerate dehydrogenase-like enzyme